MVKYGSLSFWVHNEKDKMNFILIGSNYSLSLWICRYAYNIRVTHCSPRLETEKRTLIIKDIRAWYQSIIVNIYIKSLFRYHDSFEMLAREMSQTPSKTSSSEFRCCLFLDISKHLVLFFTMLNWEKLCKRELICIG